MCSGLYSGFLELICRCRSHKKQHCTGSLFLCVSFFRCVQVLLYSTWLQYSTVLILSWLSLNSSLLYKHELCSCIRLSHIIADPIFMVCHLSIPEFRYWSKNLLEPLLCLNGRIIFSSCLATTVHVVCLHLGSAVYNVHIAISQNSYYIYSILLGWNQPCHFHNKDLIPALTHRDLCVFMYS